MNLGKKPELIFQQHSNNRTIVNKQYYKLLENGAKK